MKYCVTLLSVLALTVPSLAVAQSDDKDSGWTKQERAWLDGKSAEDFQKLMAHLESDAPLDSSKQTRLGKELEDWPRKAKVAPDSWIDTLMDGEKPSLIEYASVLSFAGRDIDDSQLEKLIDNQAFRDVLSSGSVHRLNLSDNPIGDAGAKALAESGLLEEVDRVDFDNTDIGESGADALCETHRSPPPNINGLKHPCKQVKKKTIIGTIGSKDSDLAESLKKDQEKTSMEAAFDSEKGVTDDPDGDSDNTNSDDDTDAETETAGTGQLSVRVIEKRLAQEANDQVRGCYERHLRSDPEASGKVAITFKIGRDGKVTKTNVVKYAFGGHVAACIQNVISDIRFPRPKGGTVMVKKTFQFDTDDDSSSDDSSGDTEEKQ